MPPKQDKEGFESNAIASNSKKPRKVKAKKEQKYEKPRKTDRVVLHKHARDMVVRVYDFMKSEARADYAEKLKNARWRTATACGISEKTVSRIMKEIKNKRKAGALDGVGAILDGKLGAVGDVGDALRSLTRGDVSGAIDNVGTAIGSVVDGDVRGVELATRGVTNAIPNLASPIDDAVDLARGLTGTGLQAGQSVIDGKLSAVNSLLDAAPAILSGDIGGAVQDVGNAVTDVVNGDLGAVGIIGNAAGGFKHSIFDY